MDSSREPILSKRPSNGTSSFVSSLSVFSLTFDECRWYFVPAGSTSGGDDSSDDSSNDDGAVSAAKLNALKGSKAAKVAAAPVEQVQEEAAPAPQEQEAPPTIQEAAPPSDPNASSELSLDEQHAKFGYYTTTRSTISIKEVDVSGVNKADKSSWVCRHSGWWLARHPNYVYKAGHVECASDLEAYLKDHPSSARRLAKRASHHDMAQKLQKKGQQTYYIIAVDHILVRFFLESKVSSFLGNIELTRLLPCTGYVYSSYRWILPLYVRWIHFDHSQPLEQRRRLSTMDCLLRLISSTLPPGLARPLPSSTAAFLLLEGFRSFISHYRQPVFFHFFSYVPLSLSLFVYTPLSPFFHTITSYLCLHRFVLIFLLMLTTSIFSVSGSFLGIRRNGILLIHDLTLYSLTRSMILKTVRE